MNELNQHRRVLTLFFCLSYDSADLVVVAYLIAHLVGNM